MVQKKTTLVVSPFPSVPEEIMATLNSSIGRVAKYFQAQVILWHQSRPKSLICKKDSLQKDVFLGVKICLRIIPGGIGITLVPVCFSKRFRSLVPKKFLQRITLTGSSLRDTDQEALTKIGKCLEPKLVIAWLATTQITPEMLRLRRR